jgi:hypothetical protein
VPNAMVEEASGEGVYVAPKTPIVVLPNIELPIYTPNGLAFPKGLELRGLVFAVLVCASVGCDPNGLELDFPNGLLDPNIGPTRCRESNKLFNSEITASPLKARITLQEPRDGPCVMSNTQPMLDVYAEDTVRKKTNVLSW